MSERRPPDCKPPRPRRLSSRTLHQAESAADCPVHVVDLDRLQRTFGQLMDAAALAVHRAGHDHDDVIVQRYLVCSPGDGEEREVELFWLADRDRLGAAIRASMPVGAAEVTIVRAGVRTVLDCDSMA